jgi:hypothetical protein
MQLLPFETIGDVSVVSGVPDDHEFGNLGRSASLGPKCVLETAPGVQAWGTDTGAGVTRNPRTIWFPVGTYADFDNGYLPIYREQRLQKATGLKLWVMTAGPQDQSASAGPAVEEEEEDPLQHRTQPGLTFSRRKVALVEPSKQVLVCDTNGNVSRRPAANSATAQHVDARLAAADDRVPDCLPSNKREPPESQWYVYFKTGEVQEFPTSANASSTIVLRNVRHPNCWFRPEFGSLYARTAWTGKEDGTPRSDALVSMARIRV